jgi:hypothetical protein
VKLLYIITHVLNLMGFVGKSLMSANEEDKYFMGFERSTEFERLWFRLQRLEKWKELAIRPAPSECDPDDLMLLEDEVDDVPELQARCSRVRQQLNEQLPPIQEALDSHLDAKPSNIKDAGLGLFYVPPSPETIPAGTTLCHYTGHIHNFQSARSINDNSYLMMVQGDILVDPGPVKSVKARYINDPLNEELINCKYVPDGLRSAVVATRPIQPGDELFVAYGDIYWNGHKGMGNILRVQ